MEGFMNEGLTQSLAGLSLEDKRALLGRLLEKSPARLAPLSFAQQRLWLMEQLQPGTATYNIPVAAHLEGHLDTEALAQSFNEIVRRHAALRTTLRVIGGEPAQFVAPRLKIEAPILDLSKCESKIREAEARRLVAEDARRPFDLEKGPLLRIKLLKLGEREHVLALTMHHVISDGWSLRALLRELAHLYAAFSRREPPALAELPFQYADYSDWQRKRLTGARLDRLLAYWRAALSGAQSALDLPSDRPRPSVRSYAGARHPFKIYRGLTESLKELSRSEGCTLFMTLLAGFQSLLFRYTGQSDIVVGAPVANRITEEAENLIGCFMNMLPLRARLSGDLRFRDLLRHVREVTLGAYERQELPFEKLVEELQPERDLGRAPLFQVLLALHDFPGDLLELPGLRSSFWDVETQTAKFDLFLNLSERDGLLEGAFEYSADLFDPISVQEMTRGFIRLLDSVRVNADQRIGDLTLLDADEERRLIVEWNATAREFPHERCFQELFEAQAALSPDRVAVECGGSSLTYSELNRRANQLAARLRHLGVRPESTVGVFVDRSVEMVLALLGTLKAGGAYVPLDPAYPRRRLSLMLEDSGAEVLVTTRVRFLASLTEYNGKVVFLDEDSEEPAEGDFDNPPRNGTGENAAYVIYTSGSTGRPKGVIVRRLSLVNLLLGMAESLGGADDDILLSVTTVSFDIAALELFLPLLVGARVAIAPSQAVNDPSKLKELLDSSHASVLQATPSTYHLLLEGDDGLLARRSLKKLLCGGEALDEPLARRLASGGAGLWNLYGPTETTIWSSSQRIETAGAAVPIGRPIVNTQLFVLDARLRAVPRGATGGLYIGGDGLARGYHGLPDLTAERFVPNPFSVEPGARMFETGDLVRHLPGGELSYVGRGDQQIKLRGYRIELAEIESALCLHESVRQAAVLLRGAGDGDRHLVAYVTAERGAEPSVGELREALASRLPHYMIPSRFVVLEEMPLTDNGKINRRALPNCAHYDVSGGGYTAPRTAVEQGLSDIWRELLGVERVGASDNFFEMGGHSLLATRLLSHVRDRFAVELSLRVVFESPTVETLAARIEADLLRDDREGPAPVRRALSLTTAPPSFVQQRLWFMHRLEPRSAAYNIPSAVRLSGKLNTVALARSLNEVVRRHEILRTTFAEDPGGLTQVIAPAATLNMSVTDLAGLSESECESEASRLAEAAARLPFDLEKGPLARAHLIRLAEDEHVLSLALHHIIFDGWSLSLLVRELTQLYEAFSQGKPSPLADLRFQYADYAVWQRDRVRGETLERQLAYWRRQLDGAPPLNLSTDRPVTAATSDSGATLTFALTADVVSALESLSLESGATLFMTLLATFATLLSYRSKQEDIVIGTPVAGRTCVEFENLIGCFLNTLALRMDLGGDPTFRELVERVRKVTLDAYGRQDLPFEKLVEEVNRAKGLGRAPLIRAWFAFQNIPKQKAELPGLVISALDVDRGVAQFDLELLMWKQAGGYSGSFKYKTDLFDSTAAVRMTERFGLLTRIVAARPDAKLSSLMKSLEEADRRDRYQQAGTLKELGRAKMKGLRRKTISS
jgi:amino acid adenylation domain-containing protein